MLAPETHLKERYRILHKIGGGGFGYVYQAVDEVFGCSVAIKETREEIANLDKLRRAFEREAKLLHDLKHDSLPRVTDYFFQDQAQYLVMDFIEGEDLAARLRKRLQQHQGPFTCQELLPLADKILNALEYLHSRPEPIIHRDIKPSNIKLTDDGEVYLLDFGLAKGATGQMSTIVEGQPESIVPGFTREYAPLEQLLNTDSEPQSDIYSFGATLYQLLTAQLPVSATQRDDALQKGDSDPLRPTHEVNPAIPVAVSQIISQALAVRWWDRIDSAVEMRAALRRACEEPSATQPSSTTRAKSRSASLDSEEKVSTLLLSPLRGPITPDDNIALSPAQTQTRPRRLRRSWLIAGIALVLLTGLVVALRFAFPRWFTPTAQTKSETQAAAPSPENPKQPVIATPADLNPKQTLLGHTGTVWSVAFSPDGSLAASASEDGTIILWDTKTWSPTSFSPLKGHTGAVYSVAFSPDGKILASGSSDKTIKLWNTQTGQPIDILPIEHTKPVLRVAFSPDGNMLASCGGENRVGCEEFRIWYARSGWRRPETLKGNIKAVFGLAFSPDSNFLAVASFNKTVHLWNLQNDKDNKDLSVDQPLTSLAFSEDGKYMACGSRDKTIRLWLYEPQARKWRKLDPLSGEHKGLITSIAFSPDNKTLASASDDNTVRLWDVTTGAPSPLPTTQNKIQAPQWSVAFSPDGQTLITGGKDNMVWVWR